VATNIRVKLPTLPAFVALAFRNELQDHMQIGFKNIKRQCTLFVNLVTFGPAMPEITRVEIVTFETIGKNSFSCQISKKVLDRS